MLRCIPLAVLLLAATSAATAAEPELPKDMTAEARAEFLKDLRERYHKQRERFEGYASEGRDKMKFKATEAEGKKILTVAERDLKSLAKTPMQVADVQRFGLQTKTGSLGTVLAGEFLATEIRKDGVVVVGLLAADMKTKAQFFVASPLKLTKPAGKKDPPVSFTGYWYAAGEIEVSGKPTPVLYQFAPLTKAELDLIKMPPDKK
jgi:hypothetical protein